MARALSLAIAVVLVGAAAPATAADPVKRVVLVNPTPELLHAARTALAPWRIDVLEFRTELIKPEEVPAIATDRKADRIAWLADGELFVLDPVTGTTERRPAPEGATDAPAAAAVALSLKTLLRLPPPPPPEPVVPAQPAIGAVDRGEPAPAERVRVVPEVGGLIRLPIDGTVDAQPRVVVGLGVVLPAAPRLRPGVYATFGPSVDAGRSSFRGSYSDVELGAQLAVELPVAEHWSIVPRVRLAMHRTHVQGQMPSQEEIDESTTGGEAGLDLAVWWRSGRISAGAGAGAGAWAGFPTYIRGNVTVYDSPTVTGQVFGIALIDL